MHPRVALLPVSSDVIIANEPATLPPLPLPPPARFRKSSDPVVQSEPGSSGWAASGQERGAALFFTLAKLREPRSVVRLGGVVVLLSQER